MLLLLLLTLTFSSLLTVTGGLANPYCDLSPSHLLCPPRQISPTCGRVLFRGVTPSQKEEILRVHNDRRSDVALGRTKLVEAGDMQELTWDDSLAEAAQAHADQCRFRHDCGECRRDLR